MARVAEIESATEPLGERLRARIRREGPISFRDWMKAALYDPIDGYYCRAGRMRQGRRGDYRTAPESSPLFAATFGRSFAKMFFELGSPSSWTIYEAGAGSGDFALGIMSYLRSHYPQVFAATTYVIDEVGQEMRALAAARLRPFAEQVIFRSLAEAEQTHSGIVFSNELIDAFPVHRVTMRNGILRELCVGLNQSDFTWVECDLSPEVADYCRRARLELLKAQIVEINLDSESFLSRAASLIEQGFVITVDYGSECNELMSAPHRRQGTLRAFRRHQLVDRILSHPGEQDLTTTVDWTQIREAGERAGLRTVRHDRLDQFLLQEGLLDEMQTATGELTDAAQILHLRTSAREMILPDGMAASFQVLIQSK